MTAKGGVAMTYGEKRKAVIFNLDKPDQREAYKFALSIDFSSWVRAKLSAEMKKRSKLDQTEASITFKVEG